MAGSGATTTSGVSAEFIVMVRLWPSGLLLAGLSAGLVNISDVVEVEYSVIVMASVVLASGPLNCGCSCDVEGVTTCFSTSDAALGSARARI